MCVCRRAELPDLDIQKIKGKNKRGQTPLRTGQTPLRTFTYVHTEIARRFAVSFAHPTHWLQVSIMLHVT